MGDGDKVPLRLQFNPKIRLEFHGATITSDAGLLAFRELDDALDLTPIASDYLQESLASRRQLSWLGLGKDVLHRWCHRSRLSGCRWTGGAEGRGGGGCCGRYGFPGDSRRRWG